MHRPTPRSLPNRKKAATPKPDRSMLVIGLGNPGKRYERTRHNVGFDVLDELVRRRGLRFRRRPFWRPLAHVARSGDDNAIWIKPTTYMNRSGEAAVWARRAYDASELPLLAVYDDADLPLGQLRLRRGGGHGGHNGIRSLIDCLGESAFLRIRLGVSGEGRRERPLADYLLDRFEPEEQPTVSESVTLAADAIDCALEVGFERAMNRFNRRG